MAVDLQTATRKVFEFKHGCVIFTVGESAALGCMVWKVYVQVIDQYRYQREWTLELGHKPGTSEREYRSHAYRHPGIRHQTTMSKGVAERLLGRFLELCEKYPSLLFNEEDDRRARHEGFVHFEDVLLAGAQPSVKLLG